MGGRRTILFAGGKTGGHLFPGVAVAEELLRREPELEIAFCGAGFELPRRVCGERGWGYHFIPAAPIYQASPLKLVSGLLTNLRGVRRARRLLLRLRPELLVVCGGFEGFPPALAARWYGVPVVLLEQNARPGLTNRVLAPFAEAAACAFPGSGARLAARRVVVTGNPVRGGLASFEPDHAAFGLEPEKLTGLVFGGSAGAKSINEAVVAAAPLLAEFPGVQWIIQTGAAMRDAVARAVESAGLRAHVTAFLDPIGAAFALADFAVARSGGGAFELALVGIPSVFVPYPHAAADHQSANARAFAAAGGAVVVRDDELNGGSLTAAVRPLIDDAALRRRMGRAMRKLGRPDAARRAAELALSLIDVAAPPRDAAGC